jgi:hypothetical protein
MSIFQRTFDCNITADKGYVQVQRATSTSQPTPEDATLIGNVVIHVLPGESDNIKESHVYLDDVDFISERSLFTTAGPVEFTNEDIRMLGKGLEVIYNEALGRLEFFRVVQLESLRYKSASEPALSSQETDVAAPDEPTTSHLVSDVPQEANVAPPQAKQEVEPKEGQYYKCVFSGNVLIETPDEMILADRFFVNDIFWPKSSNDVPGDANTGAADDANAHDQTRQEQKGPDESPAAPVEFVITCTDGLVVVPMDANEAIGDFGVFVREEPAPTAAHAPEAFEDANGRSILVAQKIDYSASTGDAVAQGPLELTFYPNDVTAAGPNETILPVKVTAREKATFSAASSQAVFEGDCLCTVPRPESGQKQDYTLSSPKLTVNLPGDKSKRPSPSADIVAAGPVELQFYVDMNDLSAAAVKGATVPAKLTAQKQARFLSASKQAIFEGQSLCTMVRQDPNFRQEYKLSAPRLTIDLPKNKNKQVSAAAAGIEHLTADGGLVRLSSVRRAVGEPNLPKPQKPGQDAVIDGIELKCLRFDYDSTQQLALAAGPGVLAFYNSDEAASDPNSDMFSLEKPCWAFVEDFETLKFFLETNLIIADPKPQGALLINHFPIVKGQVEYDRQATATAHHIEAQLAETADRHRELATLHATGGITYEDKDNRFVGTELFYDFSKAVITVQGDDVQPCLLNGALVDAIEYHLDTGRIKTKVLAPGALIRER